MKFFKKNKQDLAAIIEECRKDNSNYQELLFKRYAPLIFTICRRYEQPDFGASDILQETFILVFKNIHQFDPEKGSFKSWIGRIAVNVGLKAIRQRKMKFVDIEEYYLGEEVNFQAIFETNSDAFSEEYLLTEISKLPDGYRTIFNLFIMEGFSHNEIAELLEISPQTSKSQLSKAKKLLRKRLSEAQNKTYKKKIIAAS